MFESGLNDRPLFMSEGREKYVGKIKNSVKPETE